ncbi:unnamed protein product, partial [Iphiclides podalirius]
MPAHEACIANNVNGHIIREREGISTFVEIGFWAVRIRVGFRMRAVSLSSSAAAGAARECSDACLRPERIASRKCPALKAGDS